MCKSAQVEKIATRMVAEAGAQGAHADDAVGASVAAGSMLTALSTLLPGEQPLPSNIAVNQKIP